MKKSEQKQKLVEELVVLYKQLNVEKIYQSPDHRESKEWLSEVAAILKNLDESDFLAFLNHRQHLYPSIPLATRKHAAEQIDGFVRQKVAEYKRYDFNYLDREVQEFPEDLTDYLHDKELRDRCLDLLKLDSKFDRVVNQATQVFEDRIRIKAEMNQKSQGVDLINKVLNGDLSKTILKISNDPDEHEGFCHIARGTILNFRNPSHHQLTDKVTREQALKICGFIDVLLSMLDKAEKVR